MVDTVRTYSDILTVLFQDGQPDGSVNVQDVRDLIVSLAAGNQELVTPSFNEYLTAGIALDTGSPSTSPDLATFRDGLKFNAFTGAGTSVEEAFFQIHIEHDYLKGSDLTFHAHWAHNILSPVGSVKWGIEYTIAKGYGAGLFGATTLLSTTQATGAQYVHQITDDDDMVIPGTNPELEPDALILGRIFRDPADIADTFDNDAFLLHLDMHYQIGRLGGTVERNRPWTAEGF